MAPVYISDPDTERLVRTLAARLKLGLTEAIRMAVLSELEKEGEVLEAPSAKRIEVADTGDLERMLDKEIRDTTLDYARLRAKQRGTKGLGSPVYQMLARRGAIGTLERLVERPTDGLQLLASVDRIDLAAETIALKPIYAPIIPETLRRRAEDNLRKIGRL